MTMKFTGDRLEQAIIDLLVQRGYPHQPGEQITRRTAATTTSEEPPRIIPKTRI